MTTILNSCLGGSDWELGIQAISQDPSVNQFLWTRDGIAAGSGSTYYTYEFPPSCMTIGLQIGNACGLSPELTQLFCPPCSYRMAIAPNPVKEKLNVTLEKSFFEKSKKSNENISFKLIKVDTYQSVRQWAFNSIQKNYELNLSGIKKGTYALELTMGKERESKQVIVIE